MIFTDRREAGRKLAETLAREAVVADAERVVVLAVPRGGLPVGAEVARALEAPLDVVVARALRSPHDPEVPIGVVGGDGHVEVDDDAVQRLGLDPDAVARELDERRERVARRLAVYREALEPVDVDGAVVVVVDDGAASGVTAYHACELARRAGAEAVVLALPVAPASVAERLERAADRVVVLTQPAEFLAVGQAYQDFPQLDDETALEVVAQATPHP